MRKWNALVLVFPLLLAGCGSDDNPSAPAPVTPATPTPAPAATPTPSATSPYAGNWIYRSTLTAVDVNCGHTPADIGRTEAPIAVTIASDGTFALRGGSTGTLNAGNASLTLAASSDTCGAGSGAGGCRDNDHCDGTSVQTGDVRKWTLVRQ
ncbi:MAG: hypothetical protein ABW221_22640 [Vicinamibacteria bacterium]